MLYGCYYFFNGIDDILEMKRNKRKWKIKLREMSGWVYFFRDSGVSDGILVYGYKLYLNELESKN